MHNAFYYYINYTQKALCKNSVANELYFISHVFTLRWTQHYSRKIKLFNASQCHWIHLVVFRKAILHEIQNLLNLLYSMY